jgi:hypothetical protein
VLKAPRERIQSADFRASGHLVRVDPAGARTSIPITIKAHWFPGVLRVLVDAGQAHNPAHILFEMRPNGQNLIQIAHPGDKSPATIPFDKWSDGPLGGDFSYEDFLEPQYFWPVQTVTGDVKWGARNCDQLTSKPGPADKTHYSSVRTWLDHTIGFPVYIEKTLKESGDVKEFTYFGLRQQDGVWSASQIEVKIRGHQGSTLLIVDRGSAIANLGLADFSSAQLTKF